jgi:hypothetical protein
MDVPADLQRGVVGEDADVVWLVPPGSELCRVCRGFGEIRLLREDVERLAAPPALAEQIEEKEVEPRRPPRAKAKLPAKELLHEAVARVLREKFPTRPSATVGELCDIATLALGRKTTVSKKSIERAMPLVW